MQRPKSIPDGYNRIKPVEGFTALRGGCTGEKFARFEGETNCYHWSRRIKADFFEACAHALSPLVTTGKVELSPEQLKEEARRMTGTAKTAAEFIIEEDMGQLMAQTERDSRLWVIKDYREEGDFDGVRPAHADPLNGGQILIPYTEPVTRWWLNEQVRRAGGFNAFYLPLDNATPQAFEPGDASCHAGTGDSAHPFVHEGRPAFKKGPCRMLLVGKMDRAR